MMQKIKDAIRKTVYSIVPPPYIPASYSQAGEDAVLHFLFHDFGKQNISYLDLGTNSPTAGNNTYLFYKNGSRGVCVDADSSLIDEIKAIRPDDIVINAGVSVSGEKEADFYIFDAQAINTFNKQEAEYRASLGNYKIVKVVKVPLININDLIKNNFATYPHLLSVDIEGLDLEVLKSLDYANYPVPVICVETCTYSENHIRPKDLSIAEFMITNGYEVYADTYINTIFVNKKWFYNK
jgi:FkbM family methyltransferase